MDCINRVPFCKALCRSCEFVGNEEKCMHHNNCYDIKKGNVPTFGQYINICEEKFNERRIQMGLLAHNYSRSFTNSLRKFQKIMNYTDDDKIDVINNDSINEFARRLSTLPRSQTSNSLNVKNLDKPILPHTIKGDISAIQTVFGKWMKNQIKDEWSVPVIDMPDFLKSVNFPRYEEKSNDIKMKVAVWYRSLIDRGRGIYKNRDRMFAMMMYKYAMRNGDVTRLKYGENFIYENGRCRLIYTPRKTSKSSKSVVKVYLHPIDCYDLMQFKKQNNSQDGDYVFGGGQCVDMMVRLNTQLRNIGFTGSKGLYELRKLCIDTVLKKHGPLYASAISGDNYDTVQYFYSDPRSLNLTGLSDDDYLNIH